MDSHLSEPPRRVPQQERGERRVSALLDAAAAVIADEGYGGATMCAIAQRAGASIGSLYQFFPNMESVVQAVRIRNAERFATVLAGVESEAGSLPLTAVVERLVDSSIAFLEDHPAFLALLDAPPSTRVPPTVRGQVRNRVGRILLAVEPGMPRPKVLLLARVILQIVKAMNQFYAEAPARQKPCVVREFKAALCCYLSTRIASRHES